MGHKKLSNIDRSQGYPPFMKEIAQSSLQKSESYAPIVIKMVEESSHIQLELVIKDNPNVEIVDNYDEQYAELLLSQNAHLYRANYDVQIASISQLLEEHYKNRQPWTLGSWIYFPWNKQLVHILAQEDFEALRTIRNRDLITPNEQKKLFEFRAACFGMSVGSAGALSLSITGISRDIKLIDGAVISGSNLNRILTGVSSVGKSKALVVGRQIYEMNPYSEVNIYDKVSSDNIAEIFEKPLPINIAIDEIDDIEMKTRIRVEARLRKVPVIMATELGDTIMLDVERFDLEPNRPLFHGSIPGVEDLLHKKLDNYRDWTKHAVKIIDPKNMPLKMQKSLLKIGTTIVTHPQLGSTVMMTGGVLAFAAKSIALDHPLNSGRYVISLEKELLADHKTRKYKRHHKRHTKVIHSAINSM